MGTTGNTGPGVPFFNREVIILADTIQIRAGAKGNMPTLALRELAYVTDEQALYIGTAAGNVRLCSVSQYQGLSNTVTTQGQAIGEINSALTNKLTATKTAAQSPLEASADLPAVIAAYNSLIAALKSSGVMA